MTHFADPWGIWGLTSSSILNSFTILIINYRNKSCKPFEKFDIFYLFVAAKPSVGLGGTSFSGFGVNTVGSSSGTIPVTSTGQAQAGGDGSKGAGGGLKETNVPKELMDDIDNFKKFVKEEKSVSSDIA